jgi:hypothetical protein
VSLRGQEIFIMSEVQRFPKWLLAERFTIFHLPTRRGEDVEFHVQIYRDRYGRSFDGEGAFDGYGESIAEAAKDALKQREKSPKI